VPYSLAWNILHSRRVQITASPGTPYSLARYILQAHQAHLTASTGTINISALYCTTYNLARYTLTPRQIHLTATPGTPNSLARYTLHIRQVPPFLTALGTRSSYSLSRSIKALFAEVMYCRYRGGRSARLDRHREKADRNQNTHNNKQALQNTLVVALCNQDSWNTTKKVKKTLLVSSRLSRISSSILIVISKPSSCLEPSSDYFLALLQLMTFQIL